MTRIRHSIAFLTQSRLEKNFREIWDCATLSSALIGTIEKERTGKRASAFPAAFLYRSLHPCSSFPAVGASAPRSVKMDGQTAGQDREKQLTARTGG